MDKIGQEFYLPGILPREPWEQSGRWTGMGDNMFRLKDRKGADLCLGMTHEEVRSEEHTSELQSLRHLVCRLLLEKKKKTKRQHPAWLKATKKSGGRSSGRVC